MMIGSKGDEYPGIAARRQHRAPQVLAHQRPRMKLRSRRRLAAGLDAHIAEQTEDRHQEAVERAVGQAVDTHAAEQQDRRIKPPVRHREQLDPHADQRQVQDHQHQVADPHRGDHAPEQLRPFGHHLRPGRDALDHHGADHQGHHGVGRDAEREQRDEGGLRAGVVRRFGRRHALDRTLAELVRVLGDLLLQRVGAERSEQRAAAWQDTERGAQRGAAQYRGDHALEVLLGRHQLADAAGEHLAVFLLLEIGDDFANTEHAHRHGHEADAVCQLRDAEGEAQHARVTSVPTSPAAG
jgi:hypothetical protein